MTTIHRLLWLSAAAALAAQACSSDETSTSTTTTTSSTSAASSTGGAQVPDESCVKPGDKGNSQGVGEPCTPGGGECAQFDKASACLADLGQDQWFCTRILCKAGEDCGEDAVCQVEPQGSACVPSRCLDEGEGGAGGGGGNGSGGGGGGAGGM